MFLRSLMPNICIFGYRCRKYSVEDILDITSESVFQFLVMYGCIKRGKIKRLDACYIVES